jgi:phosphonopyruvate decarboxylase
MINANEFVDRARDVGLDWYAGVPCSFLTPFINYVIGDERLTYVSAANEGDAVAAAAGAVIGGRGGVAMMQNSGLGNAVSPLTSLAYTFRIPLLVICTHRGAPGLSDEPQHNGHPLGILSRRHSGYRRSTKTHDRLFRAACSPLRTTNA